MKFSDLWIIGIDCSMVIGSKFPLPLLLSLTVYPATRWFKKVLCSYKKHRGPPILPRMTVANGNAHHPVSYLALQHYLFNNTRWVPDGIWTVSPLLLVDWQVHGACSRVLKNSRSRKVKKVLALGTSKNVNFGMWTMSYAIVQLVQACIL